jgi:hypothetical protein
METFGMTASLDLTGYVTFADFRREVRAAGLPLAEDALRRNIARAGALARVAGRLYVHRALALEALQPKPVPPAPAPSTSRAA